MLLVRGSRREFKLSLLKREKTSKALPVTMYGYLHHRAWDSLVHTTQEALDLVLVVFPTIFGHTLFMHRLYDCGMMHLKEKYPPQIRGVMSSVGN